MKKIIILGLILSLLVVGCKKGLVNTPVASVQQIPENTTTYRTTVVYEFLDKKPEINAICNLYMDEYDEMGDEIYEFRMIDGFIDVGKNVMFDDVVSRFEENTLYETQYIFPEIYFHNPYVTNEMRDLAYNISMNKGIFRGWDCRYPYNQIEVNRKVYLNNTLILDDNVTCYLDSSDEFPYNNFESEIIRCFHDYYRVW